MGEGREIYDKAVQTGDLSVYGKGMKELEEKAIADESKYSDAGDARKNIRKRQEFQAAIENKEFDEVQKNLARPFDVVHDEALAVQNIAIKRSLRERGADVKPTSEDYSEAQRTIDTIGSREKYSQNDALTGLPKQQEVIDRNSKEAEQRDLISEDLKELIMAVARSKFPDFLKQYRDAKAIEKQSLKHSSLLVSKEISDFRKDFEISVLSDPKIEGKVAGNKELQDTVNIWAERFYAKELEDFMNRAMEADNYVI